MDFGRCFLYSSNEGLEDVYRSEMKTSIIYSVYISMQLLAIM